MKHDNFLEGVMNRLVYTLSDRSQQAIISCFINVGTMLNKKTMKTLSIILIIAYLFLPVLCFGHPCEEIFANVEHSSVVSIDFGECPINHDTDNCEISCCCASYIPQSIFSEIKYVELTSTILLYKSCISLPRIFERIFVPPQNFS